MSVIEKKKELTLLLIKELEEKFGLKGDEQYLICFNEDLKKIIRNHSNKYIKTTESIVYDPSWKIKYNHESSLHKKTNDYSFIENGVYCFALEDSSLEDLTDLISILNQYFNFDKFKKRYEIYNKVVKSNVLDKSEIHLLKSCLDGAC